MMGFIWFWLVAVMIVGYVVLDGFDLGVGVLHLFLVRNEAERQRHACAPSVPVWDGNEVWLLAGGGTLYFAFPLLYASAFSGFYLPLMIVLWLLILRGISLELRNHIDVGVWRALLDGVFGFASALLTIFFGAALANVLRGVPLKPTATSSCRSGPTGSPASIPAFSTGTPSSAASSRSSPSPCTAPSGSPSKSPATSSSAPATSSPRSGSILVALTVVSLVATIAVRPASLDNYFTIPLTFIVPVGVIASLAAIWLWNRKARSRSRPSSPRASICSSCLPAPAGGSIPLLLPPPPAPPTTSPSAAPSPARTRSPSAWPGGSSAWRSPSATSSSSTAASKAKQTPTPPATSTGTARFRNS